MSAATSPPLPFPVAVIQGVDCTSVENTRVYLGLANASDVHYRVSSRLYDLEGRYEFNRLWITTESLEAEKARQDVGVNS
jgi:hypothetical protein